MKMPAFLFICSLALLTHFSGLAHADSAYNTGSSSGGGLLKMHFGGGFQGGQHTEDGTSKSRVFGWELQAGADMPFPAGIGVRGQVFAGGLEGTNGANSTNQMETTSQSYVGARFLGFIGEFGLGGGLANTTSKLSSATAGSSAFTEREKTGLLKVITIQYAVAIGGRVGATLSGDYRLGDIGSNSVRTFLFSVQFHLTTSAQ